MLTIIIPANGEAKGMEINDCLEALKRNTSVPYVPVITNDIDEAIKTSPHEWICLMHDDVIVTPKWDEYLLEHLHAENYDIIGPCTNNSRGVQRRFAYNYENIEELDIAACMFSSEHEREMRDVDFVFGFCMMFDKEVYEKSPIDFNLGTCAEVDFCLTAKKTNGFKVGVADDVYIHHQNKVEIPISDLKLLIAKWGDAPFKQGEVCK